jgi:hypothetical protein
MVCTRQPISSISAVSATGMMLWRASVSPSMVKSAAVKRRELPPWMP